MPDLTITYYDLSECGFYERGTGDHLFGSCESALKELRDWAQGKDVSMTELAGSSRVRRDVLPVYVFGLEAVGNDWILATWNTIPYNGGKVSSLAKNSLVGAAPAVHDNPIVPDTIAGFPTYFWFLPERNVFASLRFDMPITAVKPMLGYLRQFLRTESGYVVRDENEIVGYRDIGARGDYRKAVVKVTGFPRGRAAEIDRLKRDRERITTVIRDSTLQQNVVKDRHWFQRLSQIVRDSQQSSTLTRESKVHIALRYTPTLQELNEMIATEQRAERASTYDDLGFKISGYDDIVWINGIRAKKKVSVNLNVPENNVVPLVDIKRLVRSRREEFLGWVG